MSRAFLSKMSRLSRVSSVAHRAMGSHKLQLMRRHFVTSSIRYDRPASAEEATAEPKGVIHVGNSTVQIGNAPCSWGTLEFDGFKADRVDYTKMLDELVATGYTGTELGDWGFMPTDPFKLKEELEQRGITMVGAFHPVFLKDESRWQKGIDGALQIARLLAAVATPEHQPFLVLSDENGKDPSRRLNAGRITPELGLTAEQMNTFAKGANLIAAAVKDETGLPLAFHHHCAGFIETPDEITRFLDATDPDLVNLVLDTGHFVFGSADKSPQRYIDFMNQFKNRIPYLHFKDCHAEIARQAQQLNWDYFKAVEKGVFCELGIGCVDFKAIAEWLRTANYNGWITVEQDVLPGMGNPKDCAQRNRDYIRSVLNG